MGCVFLMPARINSAKMPLPCATGVGGMTIPDFHIALGQEPALFTESL